MNFYASYAPCPKCRPPTPTEVAEARVLRTNNAEIVAWCVGHAVTSAGLGANQDLCLLNKTPITPLFINVMHNAPWHWLGSATNKNFGDISLWTFY